MNLTFYVAREDALKSYFCVYAERVYILLKLQHMYSLINRFYTNLILSFVYFDLYAIYNRMQELCVCVCMCV